MAVGLRPDEPAMRLAWAAALKRSRRGLEARHAPTAWSFAEMILTRPNLVWPENSIYLKQREIIPGIVDNETIRCQSAWTRSASC